MKLAKAQDPRGGVTRIRCKCRVCGLVDDTLRRNPNWSRLTERNIAAPHVLVFQAPAISNGS